MPVLAAIDVGSNALRLVLADVEGEHKVSVLESSREPVRLGRDVFAGGVITEETINQAAEAFGRFREAINRHNALMTRAVATSALREAMNRDLFADRIAQVADIEIKTIGPEEEARLIHAAVAEKVNLKNRVALLVDVGGGSTEITITEDAQILSAESYKMGAVRMLQQLENGRHGERHFHRLLQEYIDASGKRLRREIGDRTVDLCVGTGGNMETLGDLRREVLGKDRDSLLTSADLEALTRKLQSLSFEERVAQLRLRPDRADVIVPAAAIMLKIIRQARVDEVLIPRVGLKDGLLYDMARDLYGDRRRLNREQVMASALQLGRKFAFDEQHGTTVARLAVELFDRTRSLHNLGPDHRLMLEVAALLHDIGTFVNSSDHHKHTQYILQVSPLVGLDDDQTSIVSNVARYHRKSLPKPQHDPYRLLSSKNRVAVSKLAALLRLADAMDNEHGSKVGTFDLDIRGGRVALRLKGEGDLLLEKWALAKKAAMFEEVFSVKFTVEE